MFVIGTAGHVDHGKSTLVKALTGIDPDRLREEKERGMTIDLGFAWMSLPSGREVSIVDVPGHERFIKNMLAGVGGIDLALLVVAADEAVMPQTREHLAILDLLQVKRGVVAITKRDLVDQDWLELVTAEVEELLQGTTLAGSPLCAVSAHTGQGLPELIATLDDMLNVAEPRPDKGRPRLPVDRSFVISGFGTVVTGTLTDGTLEVGQEVELVLAQKRARIRGLQSHRKSEEKALPGTRTAVNLAGVSHEEVQRGDVLTTPGWLHPTDALDGHLRMVADAPHPLKHNTTVSFYTGTSETLAKVRLLDRDTLLPGESGWVQIRVESPVAVVKGDFFIIRSSETTLGGGNVVEPHAKRHRRLHPATLEHLEKLQKGTGGEVLLEGLEAHGPQHLRDLAQQVNLSLAEARDHLQAMVETGEIMALGGDLASEDAVLLPASLWAKVAERARAALQEYHRRYPLRRGAPREEVRGRLGLSDQVSALALQRLIREGVVIEEETLLWVPEHHVSLSPAQRQALDGYVKLLGSEPFSPPTAEPPEPDLLQLLVEEGKVVKVSDSVVFTSEAYQQMVDKIVEHLKGEGKITVAQVRDMFKTSRKYALALMEHMDQRRVTRRMGDERVLR
ncbi:MAG: selenocysteine-specific translation elongation factor [Dehalococcoidia bacterium]|nr:selenocysteine-specific translation elongation factor [Dehalococcoidia bacterium]